MNRPVKHALLALGGIWVVAMLALSPLFLRAHRETRIVEQTFDEYAALLVSGDFSEAYKRCGTDFHNAMPYDKFVALQEALITRYGNLKSVRRVGYKVDGKGDPTYWRAVVDADILYEKKALRFEFVLHKEDGRWIIFGAEQV